MSRPPDPAAASRDRLRAGHADREQVIAALKDAFAHGRLTMGELDTRAGRALTARTYADLAVLTADIPPAPAPAPAPVRPPASARRRPLARAAAGSGGCVAFAVAAVWFAANVLDPRGLGNPYHPWSTLCALLAFAALCAAVVILWLGAEASWKQRHPPNQAPRPLAGSSPSVTP